MEYSNTLGIWFVWCSGQISDAGTETDSNLNQELYYHFLGTDQSEDILCWKDPENPKHSFAADITDDGKVITAPCQVHPGYKNTLSSDKHGIVVVSYKWLPPVVSSLLHMVYVTCQVSFVDQMSFIVLFQYLLLYTSESCEVVNKVYYLDLTTLPNGLDGFRGGKDLLPFTKLVDKFDAAYEAVANDDTVFTFLTNKHAPRYKLVRVDLKTPDVWTDVIPQSDKDVLESAYAVNGNQLLVCYLSDVKHVLEVRDLGSGSLLHHLPLDIGSVDGISARRKDSVVFFQFTSFLSPGIIYECNLKTGAPELKIFREIVVPKFDRSEFQVDQVFVSILLVRACYPLSLCNAFFFVL